MHGVSNLQDCLLCVYNVINTMGVANTLVIHLLLMSTDSDNEKNKFGKPKGKSYLQATRGVFRRNICAQLVLNSFNCELYCE